MNPKAQKVLEEEEGEGEEEEGRENKTTILIRIIEYLIINLFDS